jgi:flagellar basal-body rod protein FlgC
MDFFSHIQPTQDALAVQQTRLQVIAENIAHAQTTRTAEGGPYQRREVVFSAYFDPSSPNRSERSLPRLQMESLRVDETPGQRVHQPGHPDADENGYVTYPNVAVSLEMVDLMQTARAYEANLQAVRTTKEMAEKAMAIKR